MSKKHSLKKTCGAILGLYVLLAVLFVVLAQDYIRYTPEETTAVGETTEKDLGELTDGMSVMQVLDQELRYVSRVEAYFLTYGRENKGTVRMEAVDTGNDEVLDTKEITAKELGNGAWQNFEFQNKIDTSKLQGKLGIRFVFEGSEDSSAVTMTTEATQDDTQELLVNGEVRPGQVLCIRIGQFTDSDNTAWYYVILAAGFAILAVFCGWNLMQEKKGRITFFVKAELMLERYEFLIQQLVSRDFKTKYKRSVLGVFWSFLNPLLTMSVQYMVFSRIFRFQIPAYPVYLLTGVVMFNFFSEATTQAMNAITGNASLITKVYVPKYIYPISKVLSTSINLLFSLIPLFLVAWLTGRGIHWAYLMIPFGIICFLVFVVGVSFFLSTAMVFFRDMQFLWGVFTMLWMYATPIIYDISILEGTFLYSFQKINPLYYYITFFRTIIIDGVSPAPAMYVSCVLFALLALLIGGAVFRKAQDQFILHI